MTEIIPAIVPKSFDDLCDKLDLVADYVPLVHIDIVDGIFAQGKTWPLIVPHDPDFVKILHEEEGFPFWEDLEFEFHLMVANPAEEIQSWVSAGAKRIIVHFEAFKDAEKLKACALEFKKQFGSPAAADGQPSLIALELGLAVNLDTPVESILPFVELFDFVHFMSIAKIGGQGEMFDERVLVKISTVREKFPDIGISVDGGVNTENAQSLVDAGATRLSVGSAIFKSEDILGTIEALEDIS